MKRGHPGPNDDAALCSVGLMDLPSDALAVICSHIDHTSLISVQFVSSEFRRIIFGVIKPLWTKVPYLINNKHNIIEYALDGDLESLWEWAYALGCPIRRVKSCLRAYTIRAMQWLERVTTALLFAKENCIKAITRGDFSAAKWMLSKDRQGMVEYTCRKLDPIFCAAIAHGPIDLIYWLIHEKIQMYDMMPQIAARYGRVDVIQWGISHSHFEKLFRINIEKMVQTAVIYEHLHVAAWLHEKGYLPSVCSKTIVIHMVRFSGDMAVFSKTLPSFLLVPGPVVNTKKPDETEIFPCRFVRTVATANALEALSRGTLMIRPGAVSHDMVMYYATNGLVEMLQWVLDRNPSIITQYAQLIVSCAIKNDQLEVLKWATIKGACLVTVLYGWLLYGIRFNFKQTSRATIEWILSVVVASDVIIQSPENVLQWAPYLLDRIMRLEDMELMEILLKYYKNNILLPVASYSMKKPAKTFAAMLKRNREDIITRIMYAHSKEDAVGHQHHFIQAACMVGRKDIVVREFGRIESPIIPFTTLVDTSEIFMTCVEKGQLDIARWIYINVGGIHLSTDGWDVLRTVGVVQPTYPNITTLQLLKEAKVLNLVKALDWVMDDGFRDSIDWLITSFDTTYAMEHYLTESSSAKASYENRAAFRRVVKWVFDNYQHKFNKDLIHTMNRHVSVLEIKN